MQEEDSPRDTDSTCPKCQGPARFVKSMTMSRGGFYFEATVYECPKDGPVFRTRNGRRDDDGSDGGFQVPVRRTPSPSPNILKVELPEPDPYEQVMAIGSGTGRTFQREKFRATF